MKWTQYIRNLCIFAAKLKKSETMKKTMFIALLCTLSMAFFACNRETVTPDEPQPSGGDSTVVEEPNDDIYQFSVLDGAGDSVSLSQYRGKVLLVVNTATQCGYTPQYTDLQRIYETYQDQGFVILDFPCNQFGAWRSRRPRSGTASPRSRTTCSLSAARWKRSPSRIL